MLNSMKIKIKAEFETRAFDHVRNKPNMRGVFIRDLSKVFGLSYNKAKEVFKAIKVTWEENKDELL